MHNACEYITYPAYSAMVQIRGCASTLQKLVTHTLHTDSQYPYTVTDECLGYKYTTYHNKEFGL